MVVIPLWQLQEGRDWGWNGQKERGQDDKWSMRATEGQSYGNKEAASFSWLHTGDATPAAPAHWRGVPRRTSDEVKPGRNSVPPSCLFKLPLKYFMRTSFMLRKKALVIPTMETRSRAAVIRVKSLIWFIARLAGGNWAAYFSQHAFAFLHFCSIENILDPIWLTRCCTFMV